MEELEVYNQSKDNEKIQLLKTMIETTPDGLALIDVHKQLRLSYSTIRKYVKKWNYKIVKMRVKRFTVINVIKKEDDRNGN